MLCPQCGPRKPTKKYFENPSWTVLVCPDCHIPMATYGKHGVMPSQGEIEAIKFVIEVDLFPKQTVKYTHMGELMRHYYFHIVLI